MTPFAAVLEMSAAAGTEEHICRQTQSVQGTHPPLQQNTHRQGPAPEVPGLLYWQHL